ncbi:unnamed protein product [Rhizoctonia solani]|uniref:Uncharacterized protein n=1 Tax=Rhizoctonia solani TaxID=456999 RepID=A0A8H3DX60_9AGAM|nr:unnamed protein product [Rhizoctonia solani]
MGLEIAGFVLNCTQVGGDIVSVAYGHYGKGKAQKIYNAASSDYEELKALRKDVGIDRYLTEEERQGLDKVLERLALELLLLKRTLQGLKGIAYCPEDTRSKRADPGTES